MLLLAGLLAPSAQAQETGTPFADGITVGGGIGFYLGDLDTNPDNSILKFIGASNLELLAGADRRYGQYGLGLELKYNRLAGYRRFSSDTLSFTNNALSLDVVGSYDLGLLRPDLFRVFVGVGPTLLFNPTYKGFDEFEEDGDRNIVFKDLGTRVTGNLKFGVAFDDALRIGMMLTPTDFLDGFEGAYAPQDFVAFVNLSYRINLAD